MTHQRIYPGIWTRTMYDVDWFVDPQSEVFLRQATLPLQPDACFGDPGAMSFAAKQKRLTMAKGLLDAEKAPWAENANVRRGKDNPYTASRKQAYRSGRSTPFGSIPNNHRTADTVSVSTDGTLLSRHSSKAGTPPTVNTSLPLGPSHSVTSTGSRYVEGLDQYSKKTLPPILPQIRDIKTTFPLAVHDYDLPIPLPKRSEWVRADKF
jgi:hypothetical protein